MTHWHFQSYPDRKKGSCRLREARERGASLTSSSLRFRIHSCSKEFGWNTCTVQVYMRKPNFSAGCEHCELSTWQRYRARMRIEDMRRSFWNMGAEKGVLSTQQLRSIHYVTKRLPSDCERKNPLVMRGLLHASPPLSPPGAPARKALYCTCSPL